MLLKLETLSLDLYTTRVVAEDGFFSMIVKILVFHIIANVQPSSSSKQFVCTGGNRYLLFKLETLSLDLYTTRVIAEDGFFSMIVNPRFPHCS